MRIIRAKNSRNIHDQEQCQKRKQKYDRHCIICIDSDAFAQFYSTKCHLFETSTMFERVATMHITNIFTVCDNRQQDRTQSSWYTVQAIIGNKYYMNMIVPNLSIQTSVRTIQF
eukprot:469033_1